MGIAGGDFTIDGIPTYAGRTWNGMRIEGLLMNQRVVQGVFDDRNPATRGRWAYPDTGRWDPDRNTSELVAAMPAWRAAGLLGFTVNLQGGMPVRNAPAQPWWNSAFEPDGAPVPAYFDRLRRVLDRADELGMAAIVGLFYFGQDERLRDEPAVLRAFDHAVGWLLEGGWTNVLLEVNNECDVRYEHAILRPGRVHELIVRSRELARGGRTLPVSTSYGGGTIPSVAVVDAADFLLLHGNGVDRPEEIAAMIRAVRARPTFRGQPVLFNEDDHYAFDAPVNHCLAAVAEHASWGYYDQGSGDYRSGFQSPPVDWTFGTPRKAAFAGLVRRLTG